MTRARRKAVKIFFLPKGTIWELECGHSQWQGGEQELIEGATYYADCLEGPCYRPEKVMGR